MNKYFYSYCHVHKESNRNKERMRDRDFMGHNPLLRSPKMEVPYTIFTELLEKETVVMDEWEGIWGIEDEENLAEGDMNGQELNWDFMEWKGLSMNEDEEGDRIKVVNSSMCFPAESHFGIKRESSYGFWEDDDAEKRMSLNLSLNYQEVLDAWSNRGSLWAGDFSLSTTNNGYMGEVPVLEEERARREASVLRYKEKRQTRLFSKKIRYQVRKLNADKRPRLKGRFVKRVPEKMLK